METRKINLTPSLLRDDSSGSTVKSNEVKEVSCIDVAVASLYLLRLLCSSSQGQALNLSKRLHLPRRKPKRTKSARRRRACSTASSNGKIRGVRDKMMRWKMVRNHWKNQVIRRSRKSRQSLLLKTYNHPKPMLNLNLRDKPVNYKSLHQSVDPPQRIVLILPIVCKP